MQEEENLNELIDTENYAGYGFKNEKTKKGGGVGREGDVSVGNDFL